MDLGIDVWPWRTSSGISQHNAWLEAMLEYVFVRKPSDSPNRLSLSLDNLDDFIDSELEKAGREQVVQSDYGKLGPDHVVFDVGTNVGAFVLDKDRLSLASESKFNTIRGTCCVFKGKWHYELMLGSKGVMQVGWATYNCKFSQEKGVGDTRDSYSYDGNRIRKWNVATYKYGQPWLAGDVIGCCIDLDRGAVDFYRNGCWLGEAFGDVRVGPGLAYFPAVSLAYREQLVANFGATPLRYPVDGYSPLERLPQGQLEKAHILLGWTKRILPVYEEVLKGATQMTYVTDGIDVFRQGTKTQALLLAAPVVNRLGPLMMSRYLTEVALLPLLFQLLEETEDNSNSHVSTLLDLLWAILEVEEMEACLQNIIFALLTGFRFSVPTVDFCHRKRHLVLVLDLFKHHATRRYLLQNVIFEKMKFPIFMEAKTLDDGTLTTLIPDVWYELMEDVHPAEEVYKKALYAASKDKLKAAVASLENLQVDVLEALATDVDADEVQTSREIFLAKLDNFLAEHSPGSKALSGNLCPPSVLVCFFHRLMSLLRRWLPVYEASNGGHLQEHSLYVHSDHYMHKASPLTRIGELPDLKLPIPDAACPSNVHSGTTNSNGKAEGTPGKLGMAHTYVYSLFDGIVRLYHIGVHAQLVKLSSVKDTMRDYLAAQQSLQRGNTWEQQRYTDIVEGDVSHTVANTELVLRTALTDQGRHVAWLSAVVYSKEKQGDIYWVLQGVLRTLEEASRNGQCLRYLWDHYVEACIKLLTVLINHFPPTCTLTNIPGHYNTLVRYSTFLAQHFADPRVVNTDLKDTLLRALAAHVCPPSTVRALECMPTESSMAMIKALLQPYKNRPWAQTNWILMRLWKGCGFAFRYTVAPHLLQRMSSRPVESVLPNHPAPCPSVFFQNHIGQWLEDNAEGAAAFLGSVLTQLNWAFSQFISMLQEIQNAHSRPERVFIDTRQLKICATCFDLSLGLLRVIEMVVNVAPSVVTNPTRPHWDLLLTRIFQLLSQVLNRVTSRSGCFELVVNMDVPGLEGLDHFPVLTAVAGILVALLLKGSLDSREIALSVLLAEPSFQLSTLEFLLGGPTQDETGTTCARFSLASYGEVKEEEVEQVRQLVALVQSRQPPLMGSPENSDLLCTICYAHQNSVRFVPCGHQSCRYCIITHLVNNRECFFCKAVIEKVDTTEKQNNT
ncbi:E3 ubiquitin-protein ligase RNF123-like isoform X2 [Ornithodoros turicata]|uniref:E3 ubiquitin-protein ligase RNF123-like isoform X2 n=1 Tax=Ornithodoros turicata TaxID=34597 RepID=UPI003139BA3E